MHFNKTLQKLKNSRFNTSITTFLFLKTYIFGGKFLFFFFTVTFDSIHCPAESMDQKAHKNRYLRNIYSHHIL